jgi:hypothetical protein
VLASYPNPWEIEYLSTRNPTSDCFLWSPLSAFWDLPVAPALKLGPETARTRHSWQKATSSPMRGRPKKPGQYALLSRAMDANGNVQPEKPDQNYASYVINHLLPIEVIVGNL